MLRTFADRLHAGRVLAGHLAERDLIDPVVLALPRGGVCVAVPVAEVLGAPLEVLVARKLGTPGQRELAIGAIAEDGPRLVDEDLQRTLRVSADVLDKIEAAERTELERRVRRYRRGRDLPILEGRDVVLVDDGLATGLTALAALAGPGGPSPAVGRGGGAGGPALDGHASSRRRRTRWCASCSPRTSSSDRSGPGTTSSLRSPIARSTDCSTSERRTSRRVHGAAGDGRRRSRCGPPGDAGHPPVVPPTGTARREERTGGDLGDRHPARGRRRLAGVGRSLTDPSQERRSDRASPADAGLEVRHPALVARARAGRRRRRPPRGSAGPPRRSPCPPGTSRWSTRSHRWSAAAAAGVSAKQ